MKYSHFLKIKPHKHFAVLIAPLFMAFSGTTIAAKCNIESSPLPTSGNITQSGTYTGSIRFQDDNLGFKTTRTFRIYFPEAYVNRANSNNTFPVLIGLHGGKIDNGCNFQDYSEFDSISHDMGNRGFIAIYPDARMTHRNNRNWGDGRSNDDKNHPNRFKTDDVGAIGEIIATLAEKYFINENQIYASGMSNGGVMAAELACNANFKYKIKGIGMVSSLMHPLQSDCSNRNVKTAIIFGEKDGIFNKGAAGKWSCGWKCDSETIGLASTTALWTNNNRCNPPLSVCVDRRGKKCRSARNERFTVSANTQCANPVAVYTIPNGRHRWHTQLDTSQEIIDVFFNSGQLLNR
jgi:polyhydroxybutyrate depolymerase